MSYRQTGKEAGGRLFKGRVFSEAEKPGSGSGPTSTKSTARAFGSKSIRFHSAETFTPGPGNYNLPDPHIPSNSVQGDNPSLSGSLKPPLVPSVSEKWKGKPKCFGTSARFKSKQYRSLAPGPGSYNTPPESSGPILKSVFVLPKPVPNNKSNIQNPAPWHYHPEVPKHQQAAASAFKSQSKRLVEGGPIVGPPPWQYNPDLALTRTTSAQLTSTFKMPVGNRRVQVNIYDPYQQIPTETVPGPGSYDPPSTFEPKPQVLTSVFVQGDLDRFGTNAKIQGKARSEPGYYGVVLEEKERLPVSGAVFMSESERDWVKRTRPNPGPAFYKSQLLPKKLSFLRNDSLKWV